MRSNDERVNFYTTGAADHPGRERCHGRRPLHHHSQSLQPELFFLISRDVTLCYGPYTVLGVMDYRQERLQGLIQALQDAGGEVKLKPSYHVNKIRVWHLERLIFSCKMTDLLHGGGELSNECKDAAKALEQSVRRAYFNLKYRYTIDDCLLNTWTQVDLNRAKEFYQFEVKVKNEFEASEEAGEFFESALPGFHFLRNDELELPGEYQLNTDTNIFMSDKEIDEHDGEGEVYTLGNDLQDA